MAQMLRNANKNNKTTEHFESKGSESRLSWLPFELFSQAVRLSNASLVEMNRVAGKSKLLVTMLKMVAVVDGGC